MLLEGEAAEHRLTNTSHDLNTSTLEPEDAGRARGARGCSFCAFAAGRHRVRRHTMLRSLHSMQQHRWTWSCIRDTKDRIIFVCVGVLLSVLTVLPTVKSRERRWFVLKRPRSDINGEKSRKRGPKGYTHSNVRRISAFLR